MQKPKHVLFVCDGNATRSRMAEGLLRALGGGGFEVYSAGLEPGTPHPQAIAALAETDIDITGRPIPHLDDYEDIQFDFVITLCEEARESCLAFPRDREILHWKCDDPTEVQGSAKAVLTAFRRARDQLREQIEAWLPEACQGAT